MCRYPKSQNKKGSNIISCVCFNFAFIQLRRVTWWTRNDPLDPEESDSEAEDDLDQVDEQPHILSSKFTLYNKTFIIRLSHFAKR